MIVNTQYYGRWRPADGIAAKRGEPSLFRLPHRSMETVESGFLIDGRRLGMAPGWMGAGGGWPKDRGLGRS